MGGYKDNDAYERYKRREAKKDLARVSDLLEQKQQRPKETKKHIDLRKKFHLGDLIRFSQFPKEDDAVVATVIGHGKHYSILVGWRMGDRIPHTHHLASWELSTEPTVFVNDWRMFARMVWVNLPNDDGVIIDPRQPSQEEMDVAIEMLNEMRLLHNAPNKMDRYNHILDMRRNVMDKVYAVGDLADRLKNGQEAKEDVKV